MLNVTPDTLADDVEAFLTESGITATRFGIEVLNDPTLVHELRKGRECKRATRTRIYQYIENAREKAA